MAASGDCEEEERKMLLQNNAPAHTSEVVMAFTTGCGFDVFPHPPYTPDLAPSDFYLFTKLKTYIRSRNFWSNEDVVDAVNEYLRDQDKASILER